MDYLRSFIIGSTGPVHVLHTAALALKDKSFYDYTHRAYSILAPVYYGLFAMLALYLRKNHGISLGVSLFTISLLSILSITLLNLFVSRYKYQPYKNYSQKEWLEYIITNGSRHIIAYNLIIYSFEKYFSEFYPLKIFIIGSSIFSYLVTYFKVMWLERKKKLKYDYETFVVVEPFIQGFDLLISLLVYQKLLGFSLETSILLWAIVSSVIWLALAYNMGTYDYDTKEWLTAFTRVLLTGFVKSVIVYWFIKSLE